MLITVASVMMVVSIISTAYIIMMIVYNAKKCTFRPKKYKTVLIIFISIILVILATSMVYYTKVIFREMGSGAQSTNLQF